MDGYERRYRWALAVGVVLLTVLVSGLAYSMGVAQGAAQAGVDPDLVRHAWRGHWGFGPFPFLLFVFLWFALVRGPWGWGGPWGRRRYYAGWHDGPPPFDEWHRRAHERMKETPPANPS